MSIRVNWQGGELTVNRLVLSGGDVPFCLQGLMARVIACGVVIADESSEPLAGDFWLGVLPRVGFGRVSPALIGWASAIEFHLAVGLIQASLGPERSPRLARSGRYGHDPRVTPTDPALLIEA